MGCCTGSLREAEVPEDIVELDAIIKNLAADKISSRKLSWRERLCKKRCTKLQVGWNYLNFHHNLTQFSPCLKFASAGFQPNAAACPNSPPNCSSVLGPPPTDEPTKSPVSSADGAPVVDKSPPSIPTGTHLRAVQLFRTKFVNSTDTDQQFTLRTQRQTRSTCSINVQKGFTVGGNLKLEFAIPNQAPAAMAKITPFRVTGGLSGQLSWSKTEGEIHEETLIWGVDSVVQISPNHTAWAKLTVLEEKLHVDFEIESTLTSHLENNKIPVFVRRRKDNTLLQVVEVPVKALGTYENRKNFHWTKDDPGTVQILTSGTCKAVYGVEQVVRVRTMLGLWSSDDPEDTHSGKLRNLKDD